MITIDQKIAEYLNNWNIDGWPVGNLILCVIALVLSVLLCGLVGLEREKRGRNAGLRTHLLVGVGSCIIMIISIYGFPEVFHNRDVARLAAQIVTGVGFLGAGAIMHLRSGVKGLTTAATIWIVMAIGVACGSFNFVLAIIGTLIIMLVLIFFKKVETNINKKNPFILLTVKPGTPVLERVLNISETFGYSIHSLSSEIIDDGGSKVVQLRFLVSYEGAEEKLSEYMETIRTETDAVSIRLLGH